MVWRPYNYKPPKEVKGGIKAQSRGVFGEQLVGQTLDCGVGEFSDWGAVKQGRSYARRGQVVAIEIEKGRVKARVQGSRSRPYTVEILLKPLSRAEWLRIIGTLADRFLTMAKLLAGEMPPDLEELFTEARLAAFFPTALGTCKPTVVARTGPTPANMWPRSFISLGKNLIGTPS